MKRVTDNKLIETIRDLKHWDGYPPTTEYIIQALPMFDEQIVKQALVRATLRGKIRKQGNHWYTYP
ncbi:hypothetical protein GCM10017161_14950 [Thalassotalea marina]|uniref:Uncharacterized protein n=1 Tax=Thalassotalea marina TaxID=1673741 RepID=A0A919BFH5_9GAMM|nr:hypothetical protein GCM10017161_14950 [Thalassotalea marina]